MKDLNSIEKTRLYMKRRKYSNQTINSYLLCINKVIKHTEKDCYNISVNEFNSYIDSIIDILSDSHINQVINAGKLFLKYGLNKSDYVIKKLERPRKSEYIPDILSEEEIKQLIQSYDNNKHKAMISFIYCHGLRRSECLNFKISDFDKSRGIIHIREAKGRKERVLKLNDDCRNILVKYWMKYNPKTYLFEGQNGGIYSAASLRNVLIYGLKKCGISKNISLHNLRHSFACHLYDNGVPIEKIQKLLGHNDIKTTMIYTKISTTNIGFDLKVS